MKIRLLIFILLSVKSFSQLNPPSLRCIEVLPGGFVKLSWIPPPDPLNQFHSYEIYGDTNKVNPQEAFGMVATINSLTVSSFSFPASGKGILEAYYMVTKSGTTGAVKSGSSDTLISMWPFIISPVNAPDVTIQYNSPFFRTKSLTASANYTISKQSPQGNWSTLVSTPLFVYKDTVTICTGSINYQVSIADNSGCVSRSSVAGVLYSNTREPAQPDIDSISVLPDGRTILAWRIPPDKDIIRYQLQYLRADDTRKKFDSVIGRTSTSYIYSLTSANSGAVGLYVGAIDTCLNPSTLNYSISTMFLKTSYNICSYQTQLNWNEYKFMPNGLLEYAVYYSFNGSTFKVVGTTTSTSFVHEKVDPGGNLCYFIRAISKDRKVTASSNLACFSSTQVKSPSFIYLASASVKGNASVLLNLFIDNGPPYIGFDLLRSVDGQNFQKIQFISNNGLSNYSVEDSDSEPNKRSYYYKAIVKDSCGNSRKESNTVKTILLKVTDDENDLFRKHLSWSQYQGYLAEVSGYKVSRVINGVVTDISAGVTHSDVSSFTDILEDEASKGSSIEYMVTAIENQGNFYGILGQSASNLAKVYIEDQLFVPTAFAPDGYNRSWKPITHFVDKTDYRVTVFDRWGHTLFDTLSDTETWNGEGAPAGIYVYIITYKNSRGEYKEKKGMLTLVR